MTLGRTLRHLRFPLALSAAHAILWYVAIDREGVWRQAAAIDQSHDLRTAWLLYRGLSGVDLPAVFDTWIHASPVHTPLVPFASAILMLGFGESRVVAESVMPLFTTIWLVGTYLVIRQLYDSTTATWTTALVSTFPVFLIYSRTYLLDHPLAAVFALTCWTLLCTRGFSNPVASLGFGVMAGVTMLARGGGAVFLVGPVIVALASIHGEPDRNRRIRNFGLATLAALAIAATWYGPNFQRFFDYVFEATYGDDAVMRTQGSAFSLESATYYVAWVVAQGPGLPMLILAGCAWFLSRIFAISRRPSPLSVALLTVFVIDAVLLLVAAQREMARYFQPLMPLLALAICRSVLSVRQPAPRRFVAALVAALGVHHVVSLTFVSAAAPAQRAAPYVRAVPLWDHRTYFSHLVNYYRLRTPHDDFRIPHVIEVLARVGLPPRAVIGTIGTPHAFFQPNGLQLEAVRRGLQWTFVWSRPLDPANPRDIANAFPATPADALLLRSGGPTGTDPTIVLENVRVLSEPALGRFRCVARVELGDGSEVAVLVDSATHSESHARCNHTAHQQNPRM